MKTDSNLTKKLSEQTHTHFPLFAEYCILLDKGLRKEAIKCLDMFIENSEKWDYFMKADFCTTIFSNSMSTKNDLEPMLSHNLIEKIVKPTLYEMTIREHENYLVFKWYGQYFRDTPFIMKAHELNPSDYETKIILLNNLENDLWLSTHHLPEFYLGDIEEDEQNLNLAFIILKSLEAKISSDFFNRFTEYKNKIKEYKMNNNKTN